MQSETKRFLITSLTLGIIAASSGLLIGLSNLLTKDKIAYNEAQRITKGIKQLFDKDADIDSEESLTGKYVNYKYVVKVNDEIKGYAIRTTGSNDYGKITLLAGFSNTSHDFVGVYLIVNEQSYASTLVDNYINPLNKDTSKLNDVTCGATYGAKLVRSMVEEAQSVVDKL